MLLFYLVMNLKIFNLIVLILIFQNVNANKDELFGENSIIRKLINESGSFRSEIKIIDNKQIITAYEQYSFKYDNGKLSTPQIDEYYLNDLKEIYRFYLNKSDCINYSFNNSNQFLIRNLIQLESEGSIKILESKLKSPSYLLFSLIYYYDQNKDNVKCINLNDKMRCDLKLSYNSKIEYYFKNHDQLKMYPITIRIFKKEYNKFQLYKEIEYNQFEYMFNGDTYKVHLDFLKSSNCKLEKFNFKTETNQSNSLYSDLTFRNSISIAKGGRGGKGGSKDGNGEDGEDGEWGGKGGKGGSSGIDTQTILLICGLSAFALLFIFIAIFKCRNRIFK